MTLKEKNKKDKNIKYIYYNQIIICKNVNIIYSSYKWLKIIKN